MHRSIRALAVAGLVLVAGQVASAQITAADLSGTEFLGASIMDRIQRELSLPATIGDKSNPTTITLSDGFGTIHVFTSARGPILVYSGTKAIDLGSGVLLPADGFTLQGFVVIFSKSGQTLRREDFPAALHTQLRQYWPSNSIKLLASGVVARAEPGGSVIGDLKSFLKLDNISGTTVVDFEKSAARQTTGVMIFGRLTNPLGIEMSVDTPYVSFTQKAGKPKATVAIAGNALLYNKRYEFKAQGSKATAPDIVLFETDKVTPQNLVDLGRALSRPLYSVAPTAMPSWRIDLVPTFSLRKPTQVPPGMPMSDSSKVVVFAAMPGADNADWNIKGPGIKVRGALYVDALKQEAAFVEVHMDNGGFSADFGLPSLTLPDADLRFGSARARISVSSTSGSMGITAESGSKCFQQKFAFTVAANGMITPDYNANAQLKLLTPSGFMSNATACANDGVALIKWTLKVGEKVIGYSAAQISNAAAAVFPNREFALAAKGVGYTAAQVGSALGSVMSDKDTFLDIGRSVFGASEVFPFTGSKYSATDIMHWTHFRSVSADDIGKIFPTTYIFKDDLMNAANAVWPKEVIGKIGAAAGWSATDLYHWAWSKNFSLDDAGFMISKGFWKDPVMNGARDVYKPTSKEMAKMGRAAGYTATEVKDWLAVIGKVGDREIIRALGAAGYAKNEVKDVAVNAFHWSESTFESAWGGIKDAFNFLRP